MNGVLSASARWNRPDRADPAVQNRVWRALSHVDDPEYPGVSIVDLGLVEDVRVEDGRVAVDLVPTFSGCPALAFIMTDARAAVAAVDGVDGVDVRFVAEPAWTPERISDSGRARIADGFGVAVRIGDGPVTCPRCGHAGVEEGSLFGPVRCRSVGRCPACGEPVELIR